MAIYDINGNALSSGSTSELQGGTWLAMGDSIAQYMKDAGWLGVAKEKLGLAEYFSYAGAGSTWEVLSDRGGVFPQYERLKADVINGICKPTIITVALGTNGGTLGEFWEDEENHVENKDTSTIVGAMHTFLQDLVTTFDVAKVRIGGIIPPQAGGRNPEKNGGYKARNEMIRRVYEYYAIPYLDLEKEGYILDGSIVDNGTLGDGLHPSAKGNEVYIRRLCGWLPTL